MNHFHKINDVKMSVEMPVDESICIANEQSMHQNPRHGSANNTIKATTTFFDASRFGSAIIYRFFFIIIHYHPFIRSRSSELGSIAKQ